MQPRRRFTFKVRRVKDQLTSILQPHHWMWSDICKPQWFFFFFLRLVAASICDQPWFILFGTALLFLNVVTKHWSSSPQFEGVDIIWQQFFNWFYGVGILDNKTKRPYAIDMCISHSAKSANHREQRFWLFCNTLHVHLSRIRLLCFAL